MSVNKIATAEFDNCIRDIASNALIAYAFTVKNEKLNDNGLWCSFKIHSSLTKMGDTSLMHLSIPLGLDKCISEVSPILVRELFLEEAPSKLIPP